MNYYAVEVKPDAEERVGERGLARLDCVTEEGVALFRVVFADGGAALLPFADVVLTGEAA